jgi:hypothetical protein
MYICYHRTVSLKVILHAVWARSVCDAHVFGPLKYWIAVSDRIPYHGCSTAFLCVLLWSDVFCFRRFMKHAGCWTVATKIYTNPEAIIRTPGACFWFLDAFKLIAAPAMVGAATPKFHQIYDAGAIKKTHSGSSLLKHMERYLLKIRAHPDTKQVLTFRWLPHT